MSQMAITNCEVGLQESLGITSPCPSDYLFNFLFFPIGGGRVTKPWALRSDLGPPYGRDAKNSRKYAILSGALLYFALFQRLVAETTPAILRNSTVDGRLETFTERWQIDISKIWQHGKYGKAMSRNTIYKIIHRTTEGCIHKYV